MYLCLMNADDLEFIRKLWETPSVAMILQIIRESLKLQKFSMKDLEVSTVSLYRIKYYLRF